MTSLRRTGVVTSIISQPQNSTIAQARPAPTLAITRACAAVLLVVALFSSATTAPAQPLRVTSWNLQPPAHTNALYLPAVAAALQRLEPDVILLQQVPDAAMCDALADALKPAEYQVVICSAFREARTGALRKQQVAILARTNAQAYFTSSQPWRNRGVPALAGGLAFAALEVGAHRIGLFSIQAAAPAPATGKKQPAASLEERQASTIEQLLAKVGSTTNWTANQVQVFVVGGTFGQVTGQTMALTERPLQLMQDAGFGDVFRDISTAERATLWARPGQIGPTTDYIFAQPADCTANPAVLHVAAARHYPITCEVEPPPPAAVAGQPSLVDPAPPAQASQPEPPAVAAAPPSTFSPQAVQIAAALGAVLALVLGVWFLARRSKPAPSPPRALLTGGVDAPAGYTVVLTAPSSTESASSNRGAASAPRPLIHLDTTGDTQTQTELLHQRALAAEQNAERANALLRAGLLPQLNRWLKQTIVRKLVSDRAQLLQTQQAAALRTIAVEQRLNRIEQQLLQQNQTYEKRIEELTHLLAVTKEENRELIRARIAQVKAEMEAARARLLTQSNPHQQA